MLLLKVRYIGTPKEVIPDSFELYEGDLRPGKIYEVISVEKGWYRIVDASEEDYIYPPEIFEIVEV